MGLATGKPVTPSAHPGTPQCGGGTADSLLWPRTPVLQCCAHSVKSNRIVIALVNLIHEATVGLLCLVIIVVDTPTIITVVYGTGCHCL